MKANSSPTVLNILCILFLVALISEFVLQISHASNDNDENYMANLDNPLGIYEMRNHRINPENESRQNELESVELVDLPALSSREENKTEAAAKEQPGFQSSLAIVAFYICMRHFKTQILKKID